MSNSPPWLPLPSRMANLGILLISLAVHGLLLKLPVAPPPSPGLQPEAGPVVPRLPTVAVVPLPPAPPPSRHSPVPPPPPPRSCPPHPQPRSRRTHRPPSVRPTTTRPGP
ncbi:MAG: hypothetical protein ACKO21_10585 [Nodosilinea sp.]